MGMSIKSIVSIHDPKLFVLSCSTTLLQQSLYEAAVALFHAALSASWLDEKTLLIQVSDKEEAKTLRGQQRFLAQQALNSGIEKIFLSWQRCQSFYPIVASLNQEDSEDEQNAILSLLSDRPEIEAMKIAELVLSAELPTSLVCMETDFQVWTNQALANLIGTTLGESRRLDMRQNWIRDGRDDGLNEIKRNLRQQSLVEQRYETWLNSNVRCTFHSKFELVMGSKYRLTTIYSAEPVKNRHVPYTEIRYL